MADGIDDTDWRDLAQRFERALIVILASETLPADRLRLIASEALHPRITDREVKYHPRALAIPFGWKEVVGVDLGHHAAYSILIERGPR